MILITGATGLIGKQLVSDLVQKGKKIRILARDTQKVQTLFPKAEVVEGDITKKETLNGVTEGVTQVIHLAGKISYDCPKEELYTSNVEGTKNLLEISKHVKKFLFASSVSVYGNVSGTASETTPPSPANYYGESKLEAEKLVLNSDIPSIAFRLGPVYGNKSPIFESILKMLKNGYPVPKVNTVINIIHVSDASRAFQIGLEKGQGVYNIAAKESVPFLEFAQTLCTHLGVKLKVYPKWFVLFFARLKGKKRMIETLTYNRRYDVSKAQKELGFQAEKNTQSAIKEMVETYKNSRI